MFGSCPASRLESVADSSNCVAAIHSLFMSLNTQRRLEDLWRLSLVDNVQGNEQQGNDPQAARGVGTERGGLAGRHRGGGEQPINKKKVNKTSYGVKLGKHMSKKGRKAKTRKTPKKGRKKLAG